MNHLKKNHPEDANKIDCQIEVPIVSKGLSSLNKSLNLSQQNNKIDLVDPNCLKSIIKSNESTDDKSSATGKINNETSKNNNCKIY